MTGRRGNGDGVYTVRLGEAETAGADVTVRTLYCLEEADNAAGLDGVVLDPSTAPAVRERPDLLGGVATIVASGRRLAPDETDRWPYATDAAHTRLADQSVELTAVPYYAWANRSDGAMRVWIPEQG